MRLRTLRGLGDSDSRACKKWPSRRRNSRIRYRRRKTSSLECCGEDHSTPAGTDKRNYDFLLLKNHQENYPLCDDIRRDKLIQTAVVTSRTMIPKDNCPIRFLNVV